MFRHRKIVISEKLLPLGRARAGAGGGVMLLLALLILMVLAACNSTGNGSATATRQQGGSSSKTTATPPRLIIPTSSGGAPGKGPLVITSPTPVPGGRPGSQQIVLADRTLIIVSATRQPVSGAVLISLVLTVRNTGAKAMMNLPASYQLMSSEGDALGYQYNSSDNFYGSIAAHTERDGLIVFKVPAAASGLRLLYRPQVAAEAVIIPLKLS